MAVVYDPHLKERLRERKIPEEWPKEIVSKPAEVYRDTRTNVYVAIGRRRYKGKGRKMAVSYVKRGDDILIITIHPIRPAQKRNRME